MATDPTPLASPEPPTTFRLTEGGREVASISPEGKISIAPDASPIELGIALNYALRELWNRRASSSAASQLKVYGNHLPPDAPAALYVTADEIAAQSLRDSPASPAGDVERERLMFNAAREGYMRGLDSTRRDDGFEMAMACAEAFAREYCDARAASPGRETP